jgi:hypothetical protein
MSQRPMHMIQWTGMLITVAMFHLIIVMNVPVAQPAKQSLLLSYAFLLLGIVLLLVILNLEKYTAGSLRALHLALDALQGAPSNEGAARAAQLKYTYFRRIFSLSCTLAMAIGFFGFFVNRLGGLQPIAHSLMALAYIAFVYILLRYRSRWEAMYLE